MVLGTWEVSCRDSFCVGVGKSVITGMDERLSEGRTGARVAEIMPPITLDVLFNALQHERKDLAQRESAGHMDPDATRRALDARSDLQEPRAYRVDGGIL